MKKMVAVASAVMVMMGVGMAGAQEAHPAGKAAEGQAVKRQTLCPVMGGKVNSDIYVDALGKRVYFCCNGCPAEFKKDPAKYIAKMEKEGIVLDRAPGKESVKKQKADAPADPSQSCTPSAGGCCK